MRRLYRVGAIQELMAKLLKYKIHIAGLQGIEWKEKGVINMKEFTLLTGGEDVRGGDGVKIWKVI